MVPRSMYWKNEAAGTRCLAKAAVTAAVYHDAHPLPHRAHWLLQAHAERQRLAHQAWLRDHPEGELRKQRQKIIEPHVLSEAAGQATAVSPGLLLPSHVVGPCQATDLTWGTGEDLLTWRCRPMRWAGICRVIQISEPGD